MSDRPPPRPSPLPRALDDPPGQRFIGGRDLTAWPSIPGRVIVRFALRLRGWLAPHQVLAAILAVGLIVVALLVVAAAGVYDAVTESDGVAGLDQPVLRFAETLRSPLTNTLVGTYTLLGGACCFQCSSPRRPSEWPCAGGLDPDRAPSPCCNATTGTGTPRPAQAHPTAPAPNRPASTSPSHPTHTSSVQRPAQRRQPAHHGRCQRGADRTALRGPPRPRPSHREGRGRCLPRSVAHHPVEQRCTLPSGVPSTSGWSTQREACG